MGGGLWEGGFSAQILYVYALFLVPDKSLSSAQAASVYSASIVRTRRCLQGEHFVRCCHSTHSLLFRVFRGFGGEVSAAVCDLNPPFARHRK